MNDRGLRRHRERPARAWFALEAGVILAILALVGCARPGLGAPPDGPSPCREVFNATRCLVMTDEAAVQVGATREDVVAIEVVPEATRDPRPGVLIVRSGGSDVHARITLRDGSIHEVSMGCRGIPNPITCSDRPRLSIGGLQMVGYHDTPCDGEPPDGCATQVPAIEPAARAASSALRIPRIDIAIDRLGDYDVRLGEVRLPNGIVTEETADLVDDWPPDLTILSGGIGLGVRSLEPDGRPFTNVYDHGWRSGIERAEAFLVFHVDHFDPGAVLFVTNIVVR